MTADRIPQPLTDEQLTEIDGRSAHLYEYVELPDEADIVVGQDVPALLAEVQRLKGELAAEKSAHRFSLRQRNNRSNRIMHLRDLANAAASGDANAINALIEAARDTLAASRDDHVYCGPEEASS